MPTPSDEVRSAEGEVRSDEWAARPAKPPRSVFGNFNAEASPADAAQAGREGQGEGERPVQTPQSGIDTAVARAFLYGFLAKAYEDPSEEGWRWLCDAGTRESLRSAWRFVQPSGGVLHSREVLETCQALAPDSYDSFHSAYLSAFGHAARGQCPLNELEYGDLKADPLFQPHRLADLAAFYRAFGLELAEDATERQDHLCLELEFMAVLAAKEAYALQFQLDAGALALGRDAQKKFLREHLGRWAPAFGRRLRSLAGESALGALADFTRTFVESECRRFGIASGSEDLLLRPVDQSTESLCASCGVHALPPGALTSGPAGA